MITTLGVNQKSKHILSSKYLLVISQRPSKTLRHLQRTQSAPKCSLKREKIGGKGKRYYILKLTYKYTMKAQNMGSRGGLTLLCLELGTAHSQCLINVSIVDCHFKEVRAEISNSFL